MNFLLASLMFLASALPTQTYAGNGSSGGGHIFGNQLNPWFLGNTKTVNYCVEIAPEFSELSEERIKQIVLSVIEDWKDTFKKLEVGDDINDNEGLVKLATQDFILQHECDKQSDLTFQFGFLNDMQKKIIPDYKQLVGMAYRTEYDEVNLKGKGFIYIAAEKGEFRPNSSQFHAKPWSFGKNISLRMVLVHELGHVFGLQDDPYSFGGVMGSTSPETMTSKKSVEIIDGLIRTFPEFARSVNAFGCNLDFDGGINFYSSTSDSSQGTRRILNLPPQVTNLKVTSRKGKVEVFDNTKDNSKLIGSIVLNHSDNIDDTDTVPGIRLYLTKKQKVFKNLPSVFINDYRSIYYVTTQIILNDLKLELVSGKTLNVFARFNSNCGPSIGIIDNGKVHFDLMSIE